MQLTDICIYPVKSCAGLSLPVSGLDRFGLSGDRRWMVVTPGGEFISQRSHPGMCRIVPAIASCGIRLESAGTAIEVETPGEDAPELQVRIWSDRVPVRDAGETAAQWFGRQLGAPCRLVHMPEHAYRRVDGAYASRGETVSFADGFPLLLISRGSLEELNRRLPAPVPMNRFRPNLVVDGCKPFAEDDWRRIRIGALELDVAKPCARCVIPSIVQETAARDPHINRALASFRRVNGQIFFGQNLLYSVAGRLSAGDRVEVLA
jgi:uncharacterized protein YcbX